MWAIFGYIDTIDAPIHSSKIKRRIKKVEEEEEEIGKDTHKERKKERKRKLHSISQRANQLRHCFPGRGEDKTTTRAAQLNDATY